MYNNLLRKTQLVWTFLKVYNSALEVNNLLLLKDVFKYLAEKHQLEAQAKDCHTSTEKELFAKFQGVVLIVVLTEQ